MTAAERGICREGEWAILLTINHGGDVGRLSIIRNVAVSGGDVPLALVLTTPACPKKAEMREAVEKAVLSVPGVSSVDVRVGADVKAAKDPVEGRRPVGGGGKIGAGGAGA